MHTRIPEVYLALSAIYTEDVRQIEESVRTSRHTPDTPSPVQAAKRDDDGAPEWRAYISGKAYKVEYEILSNSDKTPTVHLVQAPYYPPELLEEGTSGKVVMDVEIAQDGKVAGVWLVSAEPELFSNLAAESVRQWEFEPVPAKIRVVMKFEP
jgi:TonB family protein